MRNGIAKDVFASPEALAVRGRRRRCAILVEGNPDVWFKGVPEAIEASARCTSRGT